VHQRYQTIGRRRYVSVSWLVPAAVGLPVLPAAFAWRRVWRRVKARRLNLCVNSGYDLRASPGRCPEWGEKGDRIRDPKSAAGVAGSARSEQVLARLRVRSGWVWLGEGSPKMALTRFVPLQPASGLGGAWGGGG